MAYKYSTSLVTNLFIFNILLAITGQAFAGRDIPTNSKNVDKKHPEWFFGSGHGSFFIPGIGRVHVPPLHGTVGGSTGTDIPVGSPVGGSSGGGGGDGDDAFVPSPGVEVPNPAPPGKNNDAFVPSPGVEVPNPAPPGKNNDAFVPSPGVEVPNPAPPGESNLAPHCP